MQLLGANQLTLYFTKSTPSMAELQADKLRQHSVMDWQRPGTTTLTRAQPTGTDP